MSMYHKQSTVGNVRLSQTLSFQGADCQKGLKIPVILSCTVVMSVLLEKALGGEKAGVGIV